MFPHPLALGPLNITFYGLMVAVGVLAALALFSLTSPKRNVPPSLARDFCFWMILAGLIGSRLAFVIFHWADFSSPLEFLAYWRGGLMFQGGVIGALIVSPIFIKRYQLKFWPIADVMAPSLALGQAFGRLGCLAAGCCYGRPVTGGNPLGIVFPTNSLAPAGLALWPVQIIEAVLLFILALGLTLAIRSRKAGLEAAGRVAGLYLTGTGLIRLAMEIFFRGDYRGEPIIFGLAPTTLTAMGMAVAGLVVWLWRKPNNKWAEAETIHQDR